jgi:hypothetical protein
MSQREKRPPQEPQDREGRQHLEPGAATASERPGAQAASASDTAQESNGGAPVVAGDRGVFEVCQDGAVL